MTEKSPGARRLSWVTPPFSGRKRDPVRGDTQVKWCRPHAAPGPHAVRGRAAAARPAGAPHATRGRARAHAVRRPHRSERRDGRRAARGATRQVCSEKSGERLGVSARPRARNMRP